MIWSAMNINMTVRSVDKVEPFQAHRRPVPCLHPKTLCGTRSSEKAGERETGRRKPGVLALMNSRS